MQLAIFASGSGSNFQAIVEATESGVLDCRIAVCVSNKSNAGVLDRARRHHIPTLVLNPSDFAEETDYVSSLLARLEEHDVDFIALAGYMRMIPVAVVQRYAGRMLNIHPALLPAYGGKGMYGIRVHQAVLADGAATSGATVHLVDDEYDTGPIVLQETVPVFPSDTPEQLAARVLKVEHRVYPAALSLFAENRIDVQGRDVIVR